MLPQPSHTKHAPDIRIFTPHVIHSGASDLIPIDSSRSDDEPIVGATAGAASIFTSIGFTSTGFTATGFGASAFAGAGAATAAAVGAFGVSVSFAISRYSPPLSRAAARSAAV